MGSIWLRELDVWLKDAGLDCEGWPGWQTRSRSSGGFNGVRGIVIHHTAGSSRTPDRDTCRYLYERADTRPIGNVFLARDGKVWIGAAGAANCQGKGGPVTTSTGPVPRDDGNRWMFAVEAGNNGVGEVWPPAQLDAYVTLVATLCRRLGLDPMQDIFTHNSWCQPSCPNRKIDPAGPTPSHPTLGTAGLDRYGRPVIWRHDAFRALVVAEMARTEVVPEATLQLGSQGPSTWRLVEILDAWGWRKQARPNDGKYLATEIDAVKVMQAALGAPVTGVYDDPTEAAYRAFGDFLASLGTPQPEAA